MVCFLFITPLATISGWLCLRGAVDHLHFSSRLEAVGLIALTVALFTIYLFWTLVSMARGWGVGGWSPRLQRLPPAQLTTDIQMLSGCTLVVCRGWGGGGNMNENVCTNTLQGRAHQIKNTRLPALTSQTHPCTVLSGGLGFQLA